MSALVPKLAGTQVKREIKSCYETLYHTGLEIVLALQSISSIHGP